MKYRRYILRRCLVFVAFTKIGRIKPYKVVGCI